MIMIDYIGRGGGSNGRFFHYIIQSVTPKPDSGPYRISSKPDTGKFGP